MENWEIALLIFGVASLWAPFDMQKQRRKSRKRTARTRGKVIGHEQQHSGSWDSGQSIPTKHAVIAFQVRGKEYTCVSSTGASWIIHPVGTTVPVCYEPANPDNASTVPSALETMLEDLVTWGFPVAGVGCLGYLLLKYVV